MRVFLIVLTIAVVVWLVTRHKKVDRIEMIDWLNGNIGAGEWVKMTDKELITIYKPLALVKSGVKPNQPAYLEVGEIFKKYNMKWPLS